MLYPHLDVNDLGHLTIGGHDTVELAQQYGTPLYVLDEDRIRSRMRTYREAMRTHFAADALPLYASKSLAFKEIYRIAHAEALGIDVVSSGELYTALSAGYPAESIYFHGNNKTDADIHYAIEQRIGTFIVDNLNELAAIEAAAAEAGLRQKVLLRLTPGIDPHTLKAINTGRIDSQFGNPISTGQAEAILVEALRCPHVEVEGFHSHIGSQIATPTPFIEAATLVLDFAEAMRQSHGFTARTLNLGGGIGVPYLKGDPAPDIEATIAELATHVRSDCARLDYPLPRILLEPGRSLVADAGITLYTVGGTKPIPGVRNYVTVDGGMTDNPRYALYEAPYTVVAASRMNDEADYLCTLAGRCCESGDLIQENILLPEPQRGDLIAVLTTGAYNYSMASNYNRLPRPAIVMTSAGTHRLVVRRETFADLVACDL